MGAGEALLAAVVEHLHHPDQLSLHGAQRRAGDGAGAVAGLLVDAAIEVGIGVGVGDQQALAALEHLAGDATIIEQTDLAVQAADRLAAVELLCFRVVEEQGAALGLGGLGHQIDQPGQLAIQVLLERHRIGHLQQQACVFEVHGRAASAPASSS